MPTRFAIFSLCLIVAVLLEDVSSRYLECPDGCYIAMDGRCVCPITDQDKRGVRMPFRYGKRNSILRYGKRNSFFRYGKRGSFFRYGKRGDESQSLGDSSAASLNRLLSEYTARQ